MVAVMGRHAWKKCDVKVMSTKVMAKKKKNKERNHCTVFRDLDDDHEDT